MLLGHQDLIGDFKKMVGSGRLAHGYIFFGESEVGKFYFAKHLANLLENGEFDISSRLLQDALIIENAGGIDIIRQLKNFLWQKPAISSRRLAIINDADNLTDEAQNAILKIAEEPPKHGMVILVVRNLENLLPALASRLQKIYFGRLSDQEMLGITKDKKVLDKSFGRPGRAVDYLNKDGGWKEGGALAGEFLKLTGIARSNFIKDLVELQKERPKLLDAFFETLIFELYKDRRRNLGVLKEALHRLFLIKSYNVNKRLQLEAI